MGMSFIHWHKYRPDLSAVFFMVGDVSISFVWLVTFTVLDARMIANYSFVIALRTILHSFIPILGVDCHKVMRRVTTACRA